MADMLENVQPQQQGVLPGSPLSPPQEVFMQKFRLYETRSKFYMVGRDKSRTFWKILKIDRSEPSELNIREDPTTYTERECSDLLRRIHEGNKATGGLKFVTTCYGIVGFIKFLGPYYMLLITQRRQIGVICGHIIYSVSKIEIFSLPHSAVRSSIVDYRSENRYKKLLCMVDLTKDFYFSYSYNVMRSLQKNMCDKKPGLALYETMFVWNEFLTRGIRNILQNTLWTVALVYGFFTQVRYLKRGVNEKGRVANDVETEQIVVEDVAEGVPMQISSVVQNRGSIPLFWSQETSRLNLKPDIILSKRDQTYEATRLHFEHLVKRYGNPIIILNLIKTNEKKPRESILRAEFANAIEVINKDLPEENRLKFLHWDLNKHSRSYKCLATFGKGGCICFDADRNVVTPGTSAITYSDMDISKHNYDEIEDSDDSDRKSSGGNNTNNPCGKPSMFQRGVLRTNCIDCLDRTNVAQYAYGWGALGHQLRALGVTTSTKIDLDDPLSEELMGFYERMGDTLAHQYGGSAAHNKIFSERRGQWKAAIQSQEFFRTLQRYYSNAYVDAEKQSAINIFLGHFQPQPGKPDVWELDSDQINFRRNGHSNMDENGRSLVKRSWSEGHILRESCSPTSDSNFNKGFPGAGFSTESERGTKMHSESTPDMSTSEGELSYIRYTPLPNRELFAEMQRDRCLERENGNAIDCSNFVDLDWLSSCGNSFEEELFERSMLTASPNATMLSENVLIGERTPSTSECESSTRGREQIGPDLYDGGAHNSDVFEEFSDSFVRWVTNGETLCH
ncbi:phosphoinositide phosphatase sac4 [Phtheirospermum japonicum]|uniref:Phosphoinositide phosphatase sac4 n=1 Tax=Phtheirospermum japonicum TaxID=374723 RepID=A0A830B5D1_9LAMI|nr:phosphoinositide phosphatase sac4 [Phtheirospermum japonicum]